ncbi:MAG TPA: hypothetical protein VGR73_20370 [Bryobacteraceae bacterium]|nr:hypothetical protein [Bryobacteraceae bacterium]
MRPVFSLWLIALAASGLYGQSGQEKPVTEFMGRKVTLTEPALAADGLSSQGPATVCLEAPPRRQCFTPPQDFGRFPSLTVVELKKGMSALFFSAASGGVSGFAIRYAILQPGAGKDLEDLLWSGSDSGVTLSDQSEDALWKEPSISEAPIFLTAERFWGPEEPHFGDFRFMVSTYLLRFRPDSESFHYDLEDQYLTARRYPTVFVGTERPSLLDSEKPEILARLKRVKAEAERQARTPR